MIIKIRENKHECFNIQKAHQHAMHQILLVLEHTGTITINQQPYPFDKGTLVVLPPQTKHAVHSNQGMVVLVLAFDQAQLDSLNQALLALDFFTAHQVINIAHANTAEFKKSFRRLLHDQHKPQSEPLNQIAMQIALAELLQLIVNTASKDSVNDANVYRAQQIKKYIDHHYYEISILGDIAGRFNLSARYVTQIFKAAYNQTPMAYLNEVRINQALTLLTDTQQDIITIAFAVGYDSLATFYRRFKQAVHQSPAQYRHQQQFISENENYDQI